MPTMSFPILCYHRVHADDDPSTPDVRPGSYCGHVTASQFARQMKYLADCGYSTVTQDEVGAWLLGGEGLPPRPIAIHFDDNRYNVLENGLPIMKSCGFTATMYVITGLADGKQLWPNDFRALRWNDLDQLLKAGWCIGAHTKTHIQFARDDYSEDTREQWVEEIKGSQDIIRSRLGIPADHFAYPAGIWCEEAERIVMRHFRTVRLWSEGPVSPGVAHCEYVNRHSNPYRLMPININAKISFRDFNMLVANLEDM